MPISIKGTNSNPTQISVSTVSGYPELTLSATHANIPINTPAGINIQVTNNSSSIAATGVHFDFSATGWSDVESSTCTVPANGSCILNVSSTTNTAHLAQQIIPLEGDNLPIPSPTIGFAFASSGGVVFAVDSGTGIAKIVSDASTTGVWSPTNLNTGATDPDNGKANTDAIMLAPGSGSGTAAEYCRSLPSGQWYLPAICEWDNGFVSCTITDNIVDNLFDLGFGSFLIANWSSTETGATSAWQQILSSPGTTSQFNGNKSGATGIRCVREIPTL